MPVQWLHLGAGEMLVASNECAWIEQPELGSPWFAGPMPDSLPPTVQSTRQLLDGAIAAAERAAPRPEIPPPSPRRWAWNLVSQWHCAHHSVALLPGVIERFAAVGRQDLARFACLKLEEELGHDQLPLDDLRALGYNAEAVVDRTRPSPEVVAALQYARSCVGGEHPVEFFGYVYVLERRVLRLSDEWFAALDAVLPPGVEAASGVRAHATDFDVEHVAEAVSFIAGLPADDRTRIAAGCYRTTDILCAPRSGQHPSEAQLQDWLGRSQREQIPAGAPAGAQQQGGRR
jgi:hypothetical protein